MKEKSRGSALLFVVIIFAVLFTVTTGLLAVSVTSLDMSRGYYNKNNTFYKGESAVETILYYVDAALDDARGEANDYCFLKGGGLNLNSPEIKAIYEEMVNEEALLNDQLSDETISNEEKERLKAEYENRKKEYENKVKNVFILKYKNYASDFFMGDGELKINGEEYKWNGLKECIYKELNKNGEEIIFERYGEVNDESPFAKFKNNAGDPLEFENFALDENEDKVFPRETIYIKSKLKDKDSSKYLIVSFEMNPFGVEYDKVGFKEGKIRRGYNNVLDYPLISGRNLIAANGNNKFTVNGDSYVRGSGNSINECKPSKYFGGILAGMDDESLKGLKSAQINNISDNEMIDFEKGNIIFNGDVYNGYVEKKENKYDDYFNSGFVRSIGDGSSIIINGDLYCHSIVCEDTGKNSKISINGSLKDGGKTGGNAYIADNVSLNGENSNINIKNSLIGFETANSDTNYNQSPSIVVNDNTSKLTVGKNVVLFGVAFVDGVEREGDNKLFSTIETSSIYPNYLAYTYKIPGYEDYFSNYSFKGTDTKAEMFDREKAGAENSINFLLKYMAGNIKNPEIYDAQYNFAKDIISAPNIRFDKDNVQNTSYFPFLFTADNNLYLSRDMNLDDDAVSTIKPNHDVKYNNNDAAGIQDNLEHNYLNIIKEDFVKKAKFQDKGNNDSNSFIDYLDFSILDSGDIEISDGKTYIMISKNDISINDDNFSKINNKNVLLISKGNIYFKNTNKLKLTGNIMAVGDIIASGEDVTINYNKDVSKNLMMYYNIGNKDKCDKLYKFFLKGINGQDVKEIPIVNTFNTNVKSNIRVLSRKEIVK